MFTQFNEMMSDVFNTRCKVDTIKAPLDKKRGLIFWQGYPLILILTGLALSDLGQVKVSTPLSYTALILSALMSAGRGMSRRKEPYVLST